VVPLKVFSDKTVIANGGSSVEKLFASVQLMLMLYLPIGKLFKLNACSMLLFMLVLEMLKFPFIIKLQLLILLVSLTLKKIEKLPLVKPELLIKFVKFIVGGEESNNVRPMPTLWLLANFRL
jgi:hypothetical protein